MNKVKLKVSDFYKVEEKSKRYQNDAGFLVLPDCVIARSGTLQYSDVIDDRGNQVADGELITVYRPPSALKECCEKFSNLPLTLEHPEGDEVNPKNAKELVVGSLGSNPRYEERDGEGYIICDIIVYDDESQERIKSGQTVELSAGYETFFNSNRGYAPGGLHYEAEQYELSPNHVALVERGRCGSECRVCDSQEKTKGENKMHKKEKKATAQSKKADGAEKKNFRFFIPVGDGEEMMEVTPEQAEIIEQTDGTEVEEIDEEDFDFDNVHGTEETADDDEVVTEEETVEEGEDFDEPEDEGEAVDEGEDFTDPEDEDTTEDETTDEDETLTFEVQFDDGTTGRMDEVAYEHVQRYMEMNKMGDKCGDSLGKVLNLTAKASKILGDKFEMESYTKGDAVDTKRIKKDVIRKVLHGVVVDGLKGESLDRLYDTACRTFAKKQNDFAEDMEKLNKYNHRKTDSCESGLVSEAKKKFLAHLNKKN